MSSRPLRDRRILLVEDEYYLALDLEEDLTSAGASVLGPVPSVELAMALIEAEPAIDAAVLDVDLRGTPVYPVADALQARRVPFLFATGYMGGELNGRYPDALLCLKPLDIRHLKQALRSLLHV